MINRNELIKCIELHIAKEGSLSALAKKIGVNVGALSTIIRGKYGADEGAMLARIAAALNYRERNWTTVRTIGNYRDVQRVVDDARNETLWFAISSNAGSGKTEALEDIYNRDASGAVIFIQAEEWSARQLLLKIVEKTVGVMKDKRYRTISELTALVVNWFNENAGDRPVLIIDEADKLKAPALRALIPIYNGTIDRLGAVFAGTENLKKQIGEGIRTNRKGYDEIRSRLGISRANEGYITLRGATRADVLEICGANGIDDADLREKIWNELEKTSKATMVRTAKGVKEVAIEYCEDFRRLSRVVKREKIRLKNEGING
jgi:DNA transposition AAA+ family ATPase